MAGHTPGPWKWMRTPSVHMLDYPHNAPDEEWDRQAEHDEDGECYLSFDELRGADGDEVLGGVWCNDDTAEVGVGAADARLIAAAPEMLEALKALRETWERDGAWLEDVATSAIAKAEGR